MMRHSQHYRIPGLEPPPDDADWRGHRAAFWRAVWREVISLARARGLHFLAGLALGITVGCILVPLQ